MANKRAQKSILKKTQKESLNIKVSGELNERLKGARQEARKQGFMFNVSQTVEDMLWKELEKVEKELRENNPNYQPNQQGFNFE